MVFPTLKMGGAAVCGWKLNWSFLTIISTEKLIVGCSSKLCAGCFCSDVFLYDSVIFLFSTIMLLFSVIMISKKRWRGDNKIKG